jgi:His-Xaa-Ser system protein HxsD
METNGGNSSCELRFSRDVYALDTVKKAAYRFSGHCSFEFEVSESEICCHLHFPKPIGPTAIASIQSGFRNEVLDQDLRHSIAEETSAFRNAILAYAFSRTGLQDGNEV